MATTPACDPIVAFGPEHTWPRDDFEPFVEHGHGWMLVDPESEAPDGMRNRRRILALIEAGA